MPLNPEILIDDDDELPAPPPPVKKDKSAPKLLPINGVLSKEEIDNYTDNRIKHHSEARILSKYQIRAHPGFEKVEAPSGKVVKVAYGRLYPEDYSDFEIELESIRLVEQRKNAAKKKETFAQLYFHYKQAISICSPKMSKGWNRWSDEILKLFICDKIHRILWGSGNCGKSAVYGLLLYIKWRVNPSKRMVVIASKVVKDAAARVFGYIKEFHVLAPICPKEEIQIFDGKDKGIYTTTLDKVSNKKIKNERGCIINLPIKVNRIANETGANLLGKHPDDQLILAFDEAQELGSSLLEQKIFINWYTNQTLEIHAWGNPSPVNFHAPQEWDLLFKLGGGHLPLSTLRKLEKRAEKTDKWVSPDTAVLRLCALDSPKDDPDEINNYVIENGVKKQRLHFLAGADTVAVIRTKTLPNSVSWYSQILGFPFIDAQASSNKTCLTPFIVDTAKKYPLYWKEPVSLKRYLGMDPTLSGNYDTASIVIGSLGMMLDGRQGIDIHEGKYCKQLRKTSDDEFIDVQVGTLHTLCQKFKIPFNHVAIETAGVGDVIRYAIMNKIEQDESYTDWKRQMDEGKNFYTIDTTKPPTDRMLFRSLNRRLPAKEICHTITMEYWQAVTCAFMSRQIFNVPDYIIQQFYNRFVQYTFNDQKYKIERKEDMKKRGVRSPNDADALAYMVEIMRVAGGFTYMIPKGDTYITKYGTFYEQEQSRKDIDRKLNIIASVMGITQNFGNGNRIRFFGGSAI